MHVCKSVFTAQLFLFLGPFLLPRTRRCPESGRSAVPRLAVFSVHSVHVQLSEGLRVGPVDIRQMSEQSRGPRAPADAQSEAPGRRGSARGVTAAPRRAARPVTSGRRASAAVGRTDDATGSASGAICRIRPAGSGRGEPEAAGKTPRSSTWGSGELRPPPRRPASAPRSRRPSRLKTGHRTN